LEETVVNCNGYRLATQAAVAVSCLLSGEIQRRRRKRIVRHRLAGQEAERTTIQKTVDRKFNDDGGPVACRPEQAQRTYAASKVKK
jgi:hypothetical protein